METSRLMLTILIALQKQVYKHDIFGLFTFSWVCSHDLPSWQIWGNGT